MLVCGCKFRAKNVSKWMHDNCLSMRVPRSKTAEMFNDESLSIASPFMDAMPTSSNESLNEANAMPVKHLQYQSLIYPSAPLHESHLGGVFGRMDISVADPTSAARLYPVFSDDVADADVYALRHLAIMVLEVVQVELIHCVCDVCY